MPFTPSHPAAVLPLLRTRLVPSALVIGSMVPDLPYYTPGPISYVTTHSTAGVVGIDPVLGALVFAAWQLLLAPCAVGLAPAAVRDRLAPGLPVPPRRHVRGVAAVAVVLASLVIGAATHVAWDALTHVDRWGTEHIAWLAEQHGPLAGYRWAQYASSALGLVVLAVSAARWWARTPIAPGAQPVPALDRRDRGTWVVIIASCLVAGAAAGVAYGLSGDGVRAAGFLAITWGGGAAAAAALACSVAYAPRLRVAP